MNGIVSDPSAAWRLAEQQAVDLGRTFANEPEILVSFLSEVYNDRRPCRAFQFGKGLAEGANSVTEVWHTLLEVFKNVPSDDRNATVLGGYIQGASAHPEFITAALDGVADDPDVVRDLPYLQARAGVDRDGIARLSAGLDAGKFDVAAFRQLAGGITGDAPGDVLATLLRKIAAYPEGPGVALNLLHMNFYDTRVAGCLYNSDLIVCGREILVTTNFENDTYLDDYDAGEVAEICLTGANGEESARTVCNYLRAGFDSYLLSDYKVIHLLRALFAVQPDVALEAFVVGVRGDLDIHFERPSALDGLDVAVLHRWANLDPEMRYPLMGRFLSVFEMTGLEDAIGLSQKFLELLNQAPKRAAFLGEAYPRLFPSAWSGSLADILERRRAMLEPLAGHHDPAVRSWLEKVDTWLPKAIADERVREAEREASFE